VLLVASGGVAVVHLRRGLWLVFAAWLQVAAFGSRSLLRRVLLALCHLVLSRGVFPAPAPGRGLHLLLRWGLACLAPCF
jgi:hypothetical protein